MSAKNQPSEFTCKIIQLVLAQSQIDEKGKELNSLSQTLSNFMPNQMFLESTQAEELKEAARILQRLVEKAINSNYDLKREYSEKLHNALEIKQAEIETLEQNFSDYLKEEENNDVKKKHSSW